MQILITSLCSLGAGLIAAVTVHLLTQSRDREQWIIDTKKQEFRELLSALSDSYMTMANLVGSPIAVLDEADQRALQNASANAIRVMRDRIFIVHDLPLAEISNRWLEALRSYENFRNFAKFNDEYKKISGQIIEAAHKCLPKAPLQQVKFWKR